MQYALVNEELRVQSVLETQVGLHHSWNVPSEEWQIVMTDFEFDPYVDYQDYRYDPKTRTFAYDPENPPEIEFVDLSTGETQKLTSEDIEAMVDEKVRNQVEAVLSEMAEAANLEPSVLVSNVGSVIRA